MAHRWIYFFGEGSQDDKDHLGGKGANLNEMMRLKIPVPPGFTITTDACRFFMEHQEKWPSALSGELQKNLASLEKKMGKGFGDASDPLLVSVRSGAPVSMPGMMDTILNLGLNDETTEGLAKKTGNPRFAWDAYRRFIQMFSDVVLGIDHEKFSSLLEQRKKEQGVALDFELSPDSLKKLVTDYQWLVLRETGNPFPTDPQEQLRLAIDAVFKSWNSARAITYRQIYKIPDTMGTAVTVQSMVFGNKGMDSGTGVAFTRNPSTGAKKLYGEFLMNAQGEDVVAGIRTPEPIEKLLEIAPKIYAEFEAICLKLENHFRDMQDIEFTVEEGRLFLLQTRSGKRSSAAALKVAVDLVKEKLIDEKTALLRIKPADLDQIMHPTLAPNHGKPVIARGLPASPGAATGQVVFDSKKAYEEAQAGKKVILVRKETSPDDIDGMHASQGILTATGGMTSHAAVVARGMNKCCITGCSDIIVNAKAEKFLLPDGREVHAGEFITLNGSTGEVILGEVPTRMAAIGDDFRLLLDWADQTAKLRVHANGDTPHDARIARDFGAKGIGLCRTEHMFFELDRIPVMQDMIIAPDKAARVAALDKLEVMQTEDFRGIFKAMEGFPVTVRLLDPPLHEFLPHEKKDMETMALRTGMTYEKVRDLIEKLKEVNPMLGHRGCRLMVTYPEITEMQTRAILQAACELSKAGLKVTPEIMVPLVGKLDEFKMIRADIEKTAEDVFAKNGVRVPYKIGTMMEVPRACLRAHDIGKMADFFSFGTNDLTQMTFGYSRDDVGKFLPEYLDQKILMVDPFVSIDTKGVGQLVRMACEGGRSTNPAIKLGVCGEHGGDPASIAFFHEVGLDYVSCSPYRVPVARLAAAQAALTTKIDKMQAKRITISKPKIKVRAKIKT